MTITAIDAVRRLAPSSKPNYLEAIGQGDPLFEQHGITTPLRLAHFLAQALHETGGFKVLREGMNYSAERLVKIFGVHRHSAAVTPDEAWQASAEDDSVVWLQEALNDLGASPRLIVDGRYGPATRQAVVAFQASAGIRADGIHGPVTEAAIKLRLGAIRGY